MRAASLDRLLALLLGAQLITGLLTLRAGTPATAPLFAAHGILAGALAVAIGLKIWRSVPPAVRSGRWRPLVLAGLLGLLATLALGLGFAWVVSGRILTIGSWTVLTLPVLVGLALVPILVG